MRNKKLIEGDYVHNAGVALDFITESYKKGKNTKQIDKEFKEEFGISMNAFNPNFWMYYFCKGGEEE